VTAVTFPAVPAHVALQFAADVVPYLVPVTASRITKQDVELDILAAENWAAVDATLIEPPPAPLSQVTDPLAADVVPPAT
jgi:hypothetical protein